MIITTIYKEKVNFFKNKVSRAQSKTENKEQI